jgi:hypothetical protein
MGVPEAAQLSGQRNAMLDGASRQDGNILFQQILGLIKRLPIRTMVWQLHPWKQRLPAKRWYSSSREVQMSEAR